MPDSVIHNESSYVFHYTKDNDRSQSLSKHPDVFFVFYSGVFYITRLLAFAIFIQRFFMI